MNNSGQAMGFSFIIGMVGLVIAVLMMTAFWPIIQDSFDGLRNQDELNCESTKDLCGSIGSNSTCYNVSVGNTHGTTCAMLSIGPPIILIFLILGALALIINPGQPQPQYPQY